MTPTEDSEDMVGADSLVSGIRSLIASVAKYALCTLTGVCCLGFILLLRWPPERLGDHLLSMLVTGTLLGAAVFGIWCHLSRRQVFGKHLPSKWRPWLPKNRYVYNGRCNVCLGLDSSSYSKAATHYIERNHVRYIFTVCAIEPSVFVENIWRDGGEEFLPGGGARNKERVDLVALKENGEENFQKAAQPVYPHFGALRRFGSAREEESVVRVLLVTDEGWVARNRDYLEAFQWLNGRPRDVRCVVGRSEELRNRNVRFLTDYVEFNSELWVDYYISSEVAIVSHDNQGQDGEVSEFLGRLKDLFDNQKGTHLFRELGEFIESVEKGQEISAERSPRTDHADGSWGSSKTVPVG